VMILDKLSTDAVKLGSCGVAPHGELGAWMTSC
jgi:hypothetical protein